MKTKPTSVLAFIFCALCFQTVAQQTAKVTPGGIGYLQYLPDGYYSNSNKYPIVISLHGYKEKGTSSKDPKAVLRDVPRVANVGLPKYVKYGKKYPFILISPQLKSQYGTWPASFVMDVVNHVRRTLRIDEGRIYLTGLSLGGFGVWRTVGDFPDVFAAIAPICSGGNAISKAQAIASANVPVWAFHGGSDPVVSSKVTTSMVNAINSAPKKPDPLAKVTIFPKMGHLIWDKAYQGTDLLRWMLSFRKGSSGAAHPSNIPPVVSAGQNRTLTLPDNSLRVDGSASDKDGTVVGYSWTKVSGGKATLGDIHSRSLNITGLSAGTYVFRLTAKDNDGAWDSDDITITVKAAENKPPVAEAGPDRSLTLPHSSLLLRGTANDTDGKVVAYQWTQISGKQADLSGANTRTANVAGLREGRYVFRFTVRDNKGATSSDQIVVNVRPSGTTDSHLSNDIQPVDYNGPVREYPLKTKTGAIPQRPWYIRMR